jgi:ketosteroid isomerase-like protein
MIKENELPEVIANYLKTQNEFDVEAFADNFTDDATVHDEGKTFSGRADIRKWNTITNAKYQTQMKPLEITEADNIYKVKIEMSGTFPGSPVAALFNFRIKEGKIESLLIE